MSNNGLTTPTPNNGYAYDDEEDASILSAFSIAFRGHTMIPPKVKFFDVEFNAVGNVLSTTDAYLHPHFLLWRKYGGINELARWVAGDKCPFADRFMPSVARNELFKSAMGSFDLACRNIQRGRDWGLPSYALYREKVCGEDPVSTWTDFKDHSEVMRDKLADAYLDARDVDLYTGLYTETVTPPAMLGPTAQCIIAKQFKSLKYGDRYWHETAETSSDGVPLGFTGAQLTQLGKVSLSKVLCTNLDIPMIQENAFRLGGNLKTCQELEEMDLNLWGANPTP